MSERTERIDSELVRRGLVGSREQARRLVLAGEVRIGDRRAEKPSDRIPAGVGLSIEPRRPLYASRGGEKLAGALAGFGIDVTGAVALDAGASTGGFTDCLLRSGAIRVYAVDVGYGQLDWKLRRDERVVVRERTNARELSIDVVPELVEVATADLSFISLRLVLPVIVGRLQPNGTIIALVKPQFEVGRERVGRGGVVRRPEDWFDAIDGVREAAGRLRLQEIGMAESALRGPKGNREFFLAWRAPGET